MENVTVGLAVTAGFLSFISPCVLPLVPAYIGYMGGRMTHNISRQTAAGALTSSSLGLRLHLLLHGLAFVLGFTLVFVLIGLLTTAFASIAGQYVSTFTESIGRIGGLVIIFFGLQFMGFLRRFFQWLRQKEQARLLDSIPLGIGFAAAASLLIHWGFVEQIIITLPLTAALILAMYINKAFTQPAVFWNRLLNRMELLLYADTRGNIAPDGREGLLGSAFMGMVFSAGWTPCIGPLLGTILTVAATTGNVVQGMLMLTAYSIGLGIPFVITALLMNSAQGMLRRLQRHMHKIELFSGTLLIVIGILVASGQLQSLSQTFSQGEFADFTFRVEECGVGYFEGRLELSHLGSCLNGSLIPVAINQSASGNFSSDMTEQQYLFHAEAGQIIDFEVRSVADTIVDFNMVLFSPASDELAAGSKSDSIISKGKYYPLAAYTLDRDGLYRIAVTRASGNENANFRVKVRDAEPIDTAADTENSPAASDNVAQIDEALPALADSAFNSIIDIAANLEAAVGLTEGSRAPDFTVMTVDGESVTLAELRGKIVLLNFWGTWCGPCRREMPEFQRAYDSFQTDGFEILAVAFNDTFEAIASFRDEFGLTFPLALDETGAVNDAYGIQTRPSSFLLDRDGLILTRHFGLITESQLQEMLNQAIPE